MKADVAAGLSLGEYGAILTAGAMSLEDVFRVVRQRGILMQDAVPSGGAMCAVLGMDGEKIAKICDSCKAAKIAASVVNMAICVYSVISICSFFSKQSPGRFNPVTSDAIVYTCLDTEICS